MPRSVLLIDDSKTIREILKVYLMGKGLEFVEADSGERGLQVARLVPVELIIADIKMPGLSGIDLCKALRAEPESPLQRVPIILLTGERGEELREQGKAAGANAFIEKPVTAGKLLEVVDRLIGLPKVTP